MPLARIPGLLLALAVAVTAAAWTGVAAAQAAPVVADDRFAQGEAAFRDADYDAALGHFLAARAAGASGPAVEYNIAICFYRLMRYDRAARAFLAITRDYRALADLARYNLGLVYLAQRRYDAAEAEFERLLESADATLRDLAVVAATRARSRRAAAAGSGWSAYVDVAAGRDSNVALVEDSALPAGVAGSSPFVEALVAASGSPGARQAWRVDLSAFVVEYFDAPDFSQAAVALAALRSVEPRNGWRVRAGPRIGRGWLDGEGFEQRHGVSFDAARRLGTGASILANAEIDDVTAPAQRFAFVEGDRRAFAVAYSTVAGAGRLRLTAAFEVNDRLGPEVSSDRRRFAVTYRRPLGNGWALEAEALRRKSDYADALRPRTETLREIGVAATRRLRSDWRLSTGLRFSDNASSDPPFDFSRTRIAIDIGKALEGDR